MPESRMFSSLPRAVSVIGLGCILAAGMPGTCGDILFEDDFESGGLDKWDQVRSAEVTTNYPFSGKYCVEMKLVRGKTSVSDAIKWFLPGADRVHVRFYVKFSKDYQYPHHFVTLMAGPPTDKWAGFGKAGLKPDGSYFSSGMEPWFAWGRNPPPGELSFYSYFLDMKPDPKMDKYWGNSFFPPGPGQGEAADAGRIIPELDQWQCWEFMVQANSAPEKSDGAQAMWVNGKLVGKFTGIRWRNRGEVQINCLWLQHYGYDSSDPTRREWQEEQTVWFDDVVVATEYIGPKAEGALPD